MACQTHEFNRLGGIDGEGDTTQAPEGYRGVSFTLARVGCQSDVRISESLPAIVASCQQADRAHQPMTGPLILQAVDQVPQMRRERLFGFRYLPFNCARTREVPSVDIFGVASQRKKVEGFV